MYLCLKKYYFCDINILIMLNFVFEPTVPYNSLPPLPPKVNLLTPSIFKKTIEANRALAELKGFASLLPDQNILINSLVLKEAKDSSEVENIITTHDELYKAFSIKGNILNPALKEVLNYREAVWTGYNLIKERGFITTREIIRIQEVLEKNNAGIRTQSGTALRNAKTGEVIYTPPFGPDIIRKKLANLEVFMNTEDDGLDPLIKMALIHYQFEAIHPFYDGNGRTGRILNVLYLIFKGLLHQPILYLSNYIISNKNEYYQGLSRIRHENKWEDWILYILDAVEKTAVSTISTIEDIRKLYEEATIKVKSELPQIYSHELMEVIFNQPYTKVAFLVERKIVARQQAAVYLKKLENIGLLESKKAGREMLYLNRGLLNILSD